MDVKDIVKKYLDKNRFDGLYCAGKCGCSKYNLMPCDGPCGNCVAGSTTTIVANGQYVPKPEQAEVN